jgi:hypothetical protein
MPYSDMPKVKYRVVERGARFVVESFSDHHGAWRSIDEFPSPKEANARLTKLEQIARASQQSPPVG